MRFILPHAPDATATSFATKAGDSITIKLPCSEAEKVQIETALGIAMVGAPERPKKTDGDV